ncbi:MAG TPA: hypothetical protein VEA92_01360 [Candidatus Paceibacterota bacterium]|nr:hypothetical protein [Candidatus Paceibacterota bacterium]
MPDILDDWKDFPKVGLIVNGEKKFYPLSEAVPLWDSGFLKVEDSRELLLEDFSIREMTDDENRAFQQRTDEFSASK